MIVTRLSAPYRWPDRAVPLAPVPHDWTGAPVHAPPAFALLADPERVWLLAERAAAARVHPRAVAGAFVAGLWRTDVAEMFLGRAGTAAYLEVNLAPTGAWWACIFDAPRRPRARRPAPLPGVRTHAGPGPGGGWRAAVGVPVQALAAVGGFGAGSTAAVTFVVTTPARRYLSATAPPPGAPDFHLPALRQPVRLVDPS